MAARSPQTYAKRARELAVKERRDRKHTKKAEAAARRAASRDAQARGNHPADSAVVEGEDQTPATPEGDDELSAQ
jgi:hypothetical protein